MAQLVCEPAFSPRLHEGIFQELRAARSVLEPRS